MNPEKVNAASFDVIKEIEATFGKDVLTSGYMKLKKLIGIRDEEAELHSESTHIGVNWVLEYVLCALSLGSLHPEKISQEAVERGPSGQPGGIVMRALATTEIMSLLAGWIEDMPDGASDSMKQDLRMVLADFNTFEKIRLRRSKQKPAAS